MSRVSRKASDATAKQLANDLANLDVSELSRETRAQLCSAAIRLTRRAESPWDAIGRMFWTEPAALMATKIGIDMKLFSHLTQSDPPVIDSVNLARLIGADAALTKRILRALSANGIVDELGVDTYAGNELSRTLTTTEAAASITFLVEVQMPCDTRVPAWIRSRNFQNPRGPEDCPWKETMQTDKTYFEWLRANPEYLRQFGCLMKGFNESRIEWSTFFPIRDYFDEQDSNPFIVDVGGGVGHDLAQVLRAVPESAGRLYLQDLPEVIQGAVVQEPEVNTAAHDFFTLQPINGARIYFLHSILHDWPDFKAKEIISQIIPAMRRDYSKILLLESTIALQNPSPGSTGVDLLMMSLFGAQERDENAWKKILQDCGLYISKIWRSPIGGQAIIEVGQR